MNNIKVWARVGVIFNVDKRLFEENPEVAMQEAINSGNAITEGESYIPESEIEKYIDEYGLQIRNREIEVELNGKLTSMEIWKVGS